VGSEDAKVVYADQISVSLVVRGRWEEKGTTEDEMVGCHHQRDRT